MRIVLALMAVVALLLSPVSAAAAQVHCRPAHRVAMATMDMPGSAQSVNQPALTDPCCDQGASHGMDHKGCALACAAFCADSAVFPSPFVGSCLAFSDVHLTPVSSATASTHEPEGLKRPPKSMA